MRRGERWRRPLFWRRVSPRRRCIGAEAPKSTDHWLQQRSLPVACSHAGGACLAFTLGESTRLRGVSASAPAARLLARSARCAGVGLGGGSCVRGVRVEQAVERRSLSFPSAFPRSSAPHRGRRGGEPRHTQAAKRGTCRGSCPSAQASPVSPEPQGRCFCHSMLSPDAEGPRQPPPAAPTCGCCGSGPWQSRRGVGGSLARWREAASRPCLIEAAEELPSNLHVSSSSSCSVCSCCPHARVPTAADLGSSVRHAGGQPRTRSEADAAWRPSRVSSTSVATVGALRSPSDAARFSAPTTCCHTCSPLTPHSADLPVGSPLASAPPGAAPSRAGGQGCNGCLLSSPAGHSHREFSSRSDLARAAVARDSELYTQAAATSQVPAARPAPAVGCARACRESPRPTVCEADPGDGCRPGQRQAPPAVVRRRVFLRPAVAAGQESRGLCRPGEREDLTPDDHPVRLACVQQQRTASAGLSREGVSLRGASALQQHRDLGVSPVNLSSQPVPSHRARHEPRASSQNDAGTEPPASFISSEGRGRGSAAVPPAGGWRRSEGRDWIESMRAEPESAVSARWQEDGRGPTLRTVDTSAATRTPSLRHGACSHPVPTTEEPRRRAEDLDDLHAVLERQQRELAEQLRLLDLIEMQRLQNGSLEPPKGGVRSSHPETPAGRPALQIAQAAPSPPADARVWEVDLETVRTRVPWDDPAGPRGSSQVEAGGRPDRTRGLPPHADDRQTRGGGLPPATRAETAEGGLSAAEQHEQRLRELEDVVWMLTAAERNRTGAPLHA
ncbi:hypothetical protein BESB_000590 [Besnoitia besnoiti]|uniref:Uncharacterized protein n=1 Tax=Besnoitia besnoiti TaxID=94643 RepID=A0A2A9MP16_BESBE|nr:hypothetical protein BESB_000590 [Besnoitia besnoiti]PFH37717.1 hypothetical protein BESB_000590 [Besnoitia besnoiti]